jgi:hypothetical protein
MTIPIAVLAGFASPVSSMIRHYTVVDQWHPQAGVQGVLTEATRIFTGYSPTDGEFQPSLLKMGLMPVALGFLIHKYVGGSLGINRALSQAGVPLFRL